MDLQVLSFYIRALSVHRNSKKPDSAFRREIDKLIGKGIDEDMHELIVHIMNKTAAGGKANTSRSASHSATKVVKPTPTLDPCSRSNSQIMMDPCSRGAATRSVRGGC